MRTTVLGTCNSNLQDIEEIKDNKNTDNRRKTNPKDQSASQISLPLSLPMWKLTAEFALRPLPQPMAHVLA